MEHKQNAIDNIFKNQEDYTLLSKVAYNKHQHNTEKTIEHTNYKFDPLLSSQTEKGIS